MSSITPAQMQEMVSYIRSRVKDFVPDIALVCGSGLAGITDAFIDPVVVQYTDIPHFPHSTVQGHHNELVFGTLNGKNIVAMRGRFHFYEGHPLQRVVLGARLFAALGARIFIVTNASGAVNNTFKVGDLMVIEGHMSFPGLSGFNPLVGPNDSEFGTRFPPMTNAYSVELKDALLSTAEEQGLKSIMRTGVYVGVSGPTYETRHEVHAMRVLGGDAAGMSTVPEVIIAAHAGMAVLGVALITNVCVGPGEDRTPPHHGEVLAASNARSRDLQKLIAGAIEKIDVESFKRPAAAARFSATEPTPSTGAVATVSCASATAAPVAAAPAPAAAAAVSPAHFATLAAISAVAGAVAGAVTAFFLASRRR